MKRLSQWYNIQTVSQPLSYLLYLDVAKLNTSRLVEWNLLCRRTCCKCPVLWTGKGLVDFLMKSGVISLIMHNLL